MISFYYCYGYCCCCYYYPSNYDYCAITGTYLGNLIISPKVSAASELAVQFGSLMGSLSIYTRQVCAR